MDKIGQIVPAKYSVKWLYWLMCLSLFFVAGLYVALDPSKTSGWHGQDWFGILVLGIGASLLCNLLGFLNLRIAFILAFVGVLVGLVILASKVRAMDGFGDLTGLLTFILFTILGVLVGLAIEITVFWKRKRR